MESASNEEMLPPALPLATLIGRELRGGGSERPLVRYGHSGFAKRGEDYFLVKPDCLRVPGDPSSAFSVFAVRALSYSQPPFCFFSLLVQPAMFWPIVFFSCCCYFHFYPV